jgi:hypothetical protein
LARRGAAIAFLDWRARWAAAISDKPATTIKVGGMGHSPHILIAD